MGGKETSRYRRNSSHNSFPFLSWRREEIFTLSTVAMVARGWKPGGGRGKEEEEEEKEEEEDGEEEVK